ncbi:MAG: HlyD family efflux transporter periplasmic adaptor subunit [Gammaproteobacteria bacterium]|nr:HlyD family efflux transporter periplasmic adaptor subunit [Gammaproteobacteria bacterium]
MKNLKQIKLLLPALAMSACSVEDDARLLVGQMASDRVEITAEFAEPITERLVTEGESVKAGQVLIRQDMSRIDARIEEAEAKLAESLARLAEMTRGPREEQINAARANVDGAIKELEFRETDLTRLQNLYDRELASHELRDRAKAARDAASASLDSLEAKLDELLSGTTVEELRQAEEVVRQAEARIRSLEVDKSRHTAVAPQDGVLDSLLFELGERPNPGQPMAILLSGAQSHARIYIPEDIRVRTVPGVSALVYVDGVDRSFEGIVRWVSSEAAFTPYFALTESDRGRLSFAAKIDIIDSPTRIPDGVPVEVELLLDRDVN